MEHTQKGTFFLQHRTLRLFPTLNYGWTGGTAFVESSDRSEGLFFRTTRSRSRTSNFNFEDDLKLVRCALVRAIARERSHMHVHLVSA